MGEGWWNLSDAVLEPSDPGQSISGQLGEVQLDTCRWSYNITHKDMISYLLRMTTRASQRGTKTPTKHVSIISTNSSAQAVKGDPFAPLKMRSWLEFCVRSDDKLSSLDQMLPFTPPSLQNLQIRRSKGWCMSTERTMRARRCGSRLYSSLMRLCRRFEGSSATFFTSSYVKCSLLEDGGAIPERTGR